MFAGDLEIAETLRGNPLVSRPSATQSLGSAYAVALYVRAAYGDACRLSGGLGLENLVAQSGLHKAIGATAELPAIAAA